MGEVPFSGWFLLMGPSLWFRLNPRRLEWEKDVVIAEFVGAYESGLNNSRESPQIGMSCHDTSVSNKENPLEHGTLKG